MLSPNNSNVVPAIHSRLVLIYSIQHISMNPENKILGQVPFLLNNRFQVFDCINVVDHFEMLAKGGTGAVVADAAERQA